MLVSRSELLPPSPVAIAVASAQIHAMSDAIIATIRRLLFVTLFLGLGGTLTELFLLGHYEDWQQYVPLVVLGAGLGAQGWFAVSRSAASVRGVRAAMWSCILSGVAGVLLHYQGNREFELEMTPGAAGWSLFSAVMTGATPTLAPGSMVQLGLVGLAWAFRHPAAQPPPTTTSSVLP